MNKPLFRDSTLRWGLWLTGLAAIFATAWWFQSRSSSLENRVYRIGWRPDPPFQELTRTGQPGGLAVSLVRQAAQRRGIRLAWELVGDDMDERLQRGDLDLAAFVTNLPEREGRIFQSEPYLETQLCFLVKDESRYQSPQDLQGGRVGYSGMRVESNFLQRNFPGVQLVRQPDFSARLSDLCEGRTDATFLEAYRAVAGLLQGNSCTGVPLRWMAIPGRRPRMGIGASLRYRDVAVALREEIGAMAADGHLAQTFGQWGFMTGQNLERVEQMIQSRRRERMLALGIASFALLFVIALIQAIRIQKERNRTLRAQSALRVAEQRLRLVANSMKEMVLAYDLNRRLVYANPSVERITGYTIDELTANGYLHWVDPEDRPLAEAAWQALLEGKGVQEREYRLRCKNGELRWMACTWTEMLDELGRLIGIQGSERDVTQRKQAQMELQESERRFRKLLETMRMYAVIFDLRGTLTFCNDYLLEQSGFSREELEGGPLERLLPESEQIRIRHLIRNLAATGEPTFWHGTPKMQTRDGRIRHLETNNVLLHDAGGMPYAVATIGVDVTDHMILQEQYLQAQKLESVGRLAGGVAHDFNNLLTVIIGSTQLAGLRIPLEHPARHHIENILHAGEQAADLTRQLLAFSRKQLVEQKPLHLGELVEEMASLLRRLMGPDVQLTTTTEEHLWLVFADRSQMQQVLLNLAVNARDAMRGKGALRIHTANRHAHAGAAAGGPDAGGDCVELAVSDNGAGMDAETKARIFEPFYTTKEAGHGTGLGLSTVYGIVRQGGGSISVESEPGQGATFRIRLPRTEQSRSESLRPARGEHLQGRGTVLLVEDQDEVREMTASALATFGYRVLPAAAGPEALALLAERPSEVDLLFTDVMLPGMNGRELAEEARRRHPGLKVLFASGYAQENITSEELQTARVAYLAKPFSLEAMARKVREVLDA